MKGFQLARFCLVSCLAVAAAVSAGTYTWEDEQGVVHITDAPPRGVKETVEPYSSAETSEKSPEPALEERGTPPASDSRRSRTGDRTDRGDDSAFGEAEQAMAKGDGKRAMELLLPLAERGHPRAQNGVGLILGQGMGVPKDSAAGIQWHLRAAEQGYGLAEYYLGLIYADGHGVARDPVEGARWMKRAAERGLAQAQFNLGRMYATGEGVEMDARQAADLYLRAAEQGEPGAQHNLAMMYFAGAGVTQDKTQAYRWELRAAEQGDPLAQFGLGYLYAKGEGTPQSFGEATRWVRLATERGHPFTLRLEPDWTIGHFAELPGNQALFEFFREGEDVDHWNELFTLHILPIEGTPKDYLTSLVGVRELICPRVTKWKVMRDQEAFIIYEWHAQQCLAFPPQHEVALILDRIQRYQLRYTVKLYQMPMNDQFQWLERFLEAGLKPAPARAGAR